MALPPKPMDLLTLLFRVAEIGRMEDCAFKFPAGARLVRYSDPTEMEEWRYPECVTITNDEGEVVRGTAAIECIASGHASIQYPVHIIAVQPRSGVACQCTMHRNMRRAANMAQWERLKSWKP